MMRRACLEGGILALAAAMFLAPLDAVAAARQAHPGPLGLEWGKSPADARSQLQGKLTFVSEAPAEEGAYHTIDQHYTGVFGGLQTTDVMLRFFKGQFFYMLVKLSTAEAGGSPSQVFESVVERMRGPYGAPKGLRYPPKLSSSYAYFGNLPMEERDKALPYLWNEQLRTDEAAFSRMRDQQILMGDWDPFADWRFGNKVIVQTFLWREGGSPGAFIPVWIFCKEDTFKAWRASVAKMSIIPPRDF